MFALDFGLMVMTNGALQLDGVKCGKGMYKCICMLHVTMSVVNQ